jgi:uncharacterized protein (TIGR03083 family)
MMPEHEHSTTQPPAWLNEIRVHGVALAEVAASAGLTKPVPACPGWTMADLVMHVARVHRFWRTVVDQRLMEPPVMDLARPPDDAVLGEYRHGLDDVLATLGSADLTSEVWTWTTDRRIAFVVRRLAHETAVHHADARQAAGEAWSVASRLASDGIDEFLAHFAPRTEAGAAAVDGSVHLHCTDVAGEWTLFPTDGGFTLRREHAKGDCALRGTASDLLGVLWGRLPISAVDVVGDAGVAERFVASPRR